MKKIILILVIIVILPLKFYGCSNSNSNNYSKTIMSALDYRILDTALFNRNFEQIKECIENGVDINKVSFDFGKDSILTKAILNNDSHLINYLLEQGANVNYTDRSNISVFMYASGARNLYSGYESINYCKLFLKYGADINKKGRNGYTALDFAAKSGNLEIVNFLLENGGKVTKKTLDAAIKGEYKEKYCNYGVIKRILEETLKVDISPNIDPVLKAAILGDSNEVINLINKNKLNDNYKIQTAFNIAAFGDGNAFELILQKGVNLDIKDEDQKTLFLTACKYGNIEIVKFLIDEGIDVQDTSFSDDYFPFCTAIENNQYDILDILIKNGLDLKSTIRPEHGRFPLVNAAKKGYLDIIKLLESNGYPVSELDTYLSMEEAIRNNHLEVVKYFLEKGVSPNITDRGRGGESDLIEFSSLIGNLDALKLLLEYGGDMNGVINKGDPINLASQFRQYEVVKYLIEKGALIDEQIIHEDGSMNERPLMRAVQAGNFDIVKILVKNGAGLEYTYWDNKETVLTKAAISSNHILKYLIENGANINYQNENGDTALILATKMGYIRNIKTIVESGADLNIKNKDGKTALDLAKKYGYRDIIKILESNY